MSDVELVREFEAVGFDIKAGLFHKGNAISLLAYFNYSLSYRSVREIGTKYSLESDSLYNEWAAFALQHGCSEVTEEGLEKWESQVRRV